MESGTSLNGEGIKMAVINNPATSLDTLEHLLNDTDLKIKALANSIYRQRIENGEL